MKDQHTIDAIALLHPKVRDDFGGFIDDIEVAFPDLIIRVCQGLRTFAEQTAIYAQGRTKPGNIVTYSPAGASYHNYGLSIDLAPIIFKDGKPFDLDWSFDTGKFEGIAGDYEITWGGRFPHPDKPHFEKKCGHNWRDLLHLYNTGQFIEGTKYVKI